MQISIYAHVNTLVRYQVILEGCLYQRKSILPVLFLRMW